MTDIAPIITVIKDTILNISDRKEREIKGILRNRLLRYFENAQINSNGSFSPTFEDLLNSNLFNNKKESATATDILTELVKDKFIVYQGGCYYLKGHEPCF